MGNTYFPTKKGTDASPQTGHPPASDRLGGPDPASPGSQEIVRTNSDLIGAWLATQRQIFANGTTDYYAAHFAAPDVEVYYQNYRGQETIQTNPHPPSPPLPGPPPEEPPPEEPPPEEPEKPKKPRQPPCLMVLFQQNGIAAFSMEALSPKGAGGALYKGRAKRSQWVDTTGKIVQVGQYKLAGTGYILTQIDLTGKVRAASLRLSTTRVSDGVATQADIQAVPVMNSGTPGVVYTVGGSYTISRGQLVRTQPMAVDAGVSVAPYAIAQDGTSYFFPTVQGQYVSVLLDPKSLLAYPYSNAFSSAVYTAEQPLYDTLPNPSLYSVVYSEIINALQHKYLMNVFLVGEGYTTGFVNGQSYYGRGAFGRVPTPYGVTLKQSPQDVEIYDISANHTVIKTTPDQIKGSPNFNLSFYLPVYYGKVGVGVYGFPITATGSATNHPLVANTDKSKFYSLISTDRSVTAVANDSYGDQTQATASDRDVPGVTYPATPGGGYLGSDVTGVQNYYATLLGLAENAPHLKASAAFSANPLIVGSPGAYSTTTGDFSNTADAPFPAGTASYVYTSGGVQTEAVVDLHVPYGTGSYSSTLLASNSVTAFGQTLTYSYDRSNPPSAQPPTITAHAHPPALALKGGVPAPWFTMVKPSTDPSSGADTTTRTTYTPYGSFAGGFTPWLHVSNGTHVIQGFYIGGVPYAFVDGSSTQGFLDAVAKQCKCKTTEIVAMYMDIPLDVVRAVTGVSPPDYSLSQSPAPGLPGY